MTFYHRGQDLIEGAPVPIPTDSKTFGKKISAELIHLRHDINVILKRIDALQKLVNEKRPRPAGPKRIYPESDKTRKRGGVRASRIKS